MNSCLFKGLDDVQDHSFFLELLPPHLSYLLQIVDFPRALKTIINRDVRIFLMAGNVSVRAFIYRFRQNGELEFLLGKRSKKSKFMPGAWQLPGGKRDFPNERLLAVLRKELREELGASFFEALHGPVRFGRHSYVKVGGDKSRITHHGFLQKAPPNTPEIENSDEHDAHEWHSLKDMEKQSALFPGTRELILKAFKRLKLNS